MEDKSLTCGSHLTPQPVERAMPCITAPPYHNSWITKQIEMFFNSGILTWIHWQMKLKCLSIRKILMCSHGDPYYCRRNSRNDGDLPALSSTTAVEGSLWSPIWPTMARPGKTSSRDRSYFTHYLHSFIIFHCWNSFVLSRGLVQLLYFR